MTENERCRAAVLALHREVQWTGTALILQRIARNRLAYVDSWCTECHKEWPCPTVIALSPDLE